MVSDKALVAITGILSVVALEGMALFKGIDGLALSAAIGAVATIAGYIFGRGLSTQKAA